MLSHVALHLLAAAGLALGADIKFVRPNSYIADQGPQDYHNTVFYGANIEASSHTLEDLAALTNVARVWPNRIFTPTQNEDPVPGAGLDPAHFDVHHRTGVKALHEKGIFGKCFKVAVVDTGIDYNHPDLGGGFGEGFKVAGGWDFAGNGTFPRGPRFPDDDPMDIMGHGTHVAGIVAAKGKKSGVAPEATLYAYKTSAMENGPLFRRLSFRCQGRHLRRLVSNSLKVTHWVFEEPTASVAQVGTGMVDAARVLAATTDLEYDPIALNDTRHFSRYHQITVINNDDRDIEYSFTKEDAMGADTLGSAYKNSIRGYWELQFKPYSVNATLPRSFVLKPGAKMTVTVTFQNPGQAGWPSSNLPLYSGNIFVTGSNGDKLAVPFLGVAADMKQIFRRMYFAEPKLTSMDPPVDYSLKSTFSFNLTSQDFPRIRSSISFGTRHRRYDIFEKGWTERKWSWPPVPGKNGFVGSATWWVGSGQVPQWFDTQGWNPDETNDYPILNTARNTPSIKDSDHWWFGKLTNGTKIANGDYILRFAVLIPFGRPEASDNWDTYTVPFSVTAQYESLE